MNTHLITPKPYDYTPEGSTQMLIYEHLARSRMREAEQAARKHRLVRGLLRARRWERVSHWAAQRAESATLPE
ncbi:MULTISPECIES: hypothetical protein [Actinokineospora]|uniref:Uncharacterized protein n=1 Tax=Actinokineospora fastidiosa TaxID=1816 RepID=A0A918GM40_9PSEU|nr:MULTISPECIES: hypothetical protein [Actinokineospora]UVS77270.1 hypothetical protein Actkin_00975 [Actinokineospora sp. UTMC 2448]GGS44477.1 hypothetical protein GCM10010171_44610 [Actinokineospora fastidiosa]